jgi:hypothetical protein
MFHAWRTAVEVIIALFCLAILIWPGSVANHIYENEEDRNRRRIV